MFGFGVEAHDDLLDDLITLPKDSPNMASNYPRSIG
jgi:hypothetical protein